MGEVYEDEQALLAKLAEDRAAGLTIAMTNGAFDLLHVGHLRSLQHAAELADRLLVAVNTDRSVRENKGPTRPINPGPERMELLAALGCVDYVAPFDEKTVDRLLQAVRPEVYCKGTDYTPETIPEAPAVQGWGGEVAIVGDPKDHSSSALRERLKASFAAG